MYHHTVDSNAQYYRHQSTLEPVIQQSGRDPKPSHRTSYLPTNSRPHIWRTGMWRHINILRFIQWKHAGLILFCAICHDFNCVEPHVPYTQIPTSTPISAITTYPPTMELIFEGQVCRCCHSSISFYWNTSTSYIIISFYSSSDIDHANSVQPMCMHRFRRTHLQAL